jgi:DNA-binding transcriptional MerR regulator
MARSLLPHGIFQPAEHGIKFKNKYRYYVPEQITMFKMIHVLAEIGVPLPTIKELSKSRTPETLMKLLSKHKGLIASKIKFFQEATLVICTFMEMMTEGISARETEIHISEMPGKQIILGDINDFSGTTNFYREYTRFCNAPHEPKLNPLYPVGWYFKSMDAFLKEPSQPTRFFSLDPKGYEQKTAGLYLIGYSRGYYGQTNDLSGRMAAFAKMNGLEFSGSVYNIYLFDEISIVEPEKIPLAGFRDSKRQAVHATPSAS